MPSIALVSEHASPLAQAGGVDTGGQNVYVAHVATQLARRGHRVDVFTRRDHPLLPACFQWQPGVRVIHVDAGPPTPLPKESLLPLMPAFGEQLADRLAADPQGFDLVHANFFMSGAAALPVARALQLPLVMTFHALGRVRRRHQREADRFPDERFEIEERLVREADCTIAECPQDRADLIALYGARRDRIAVVPCGFDGEELGPRDRAACREALGLPQDRFTVLQLGRIVPRKGIDNVIRAIALLRRRHGVDATLLVVGGDAQRPDGAVLPELDRLAKLSRALGVADAVRFDGAQPRRRIATYYGACDVFVTTPWYEPFGITPVEAMACARPVIGAAVGGIRTTVQHGVTGFLVAPEDPGAVAARLAQLAAGPSLGEALGQAGRARARRHFTWSGVAQCLEQVYLRVMARRDEPRLSQRLSGFVSRVIA